MADRRLAVGDPAGAQEMTVRMDQHRRQQPLRKQGLRSVEIAQHRIEQLGALNQARFQCRPFVGRDDEGQRIERPRGLAAIVEQIDGGARFLELAPRAFHAFAQSAALAGRGSRSESPASGSESTSGR
jgi:hypothetical protein